MTDEAKTPYATMIRDLPQAERPRERLRELGPGHLSNPELIAILLRTGMEGESVLSLHERPCVDAVRFRQRIGVYTAHERLRDNPTFRFWPNGKFVFLRRLSRLTGRCHDDGKSVGRQR